MNKMETEPKIKLLLADFLETSSFRKLDSSHKTHSKATRTHNKVQQESESEPEVKFLLSDYLENSLNKKRDSAHKNPNKVIRLESDVAAIFSNSAAVNKALRYLIKTDYRSALKP
jgi:hypothetical protein